MKEQKTDVLDMDLGEFCEKVPGLSMEGAKVGLSLLNELETIYNRQLVLCDELKSGLKAKLRKVQLFRKEIKDKHGL